MRIDQSTQDSCTILAPVGDLDLAAVPSLRQVLRKRLSEQPVAVICDLSGLASVDEACAAVFVTVANHPSSRWPETNLLLCGAQPAVAAVLQRLGVHRYLPVHPTVDDALAHAVARPPYLRAELPLTPSATAPATARRFVRDTCRQWRLDAGEDPTDPTAQRWVEDLVDRAVLVASELVTNAVVHSQGPLRLRLELHQQRLHLAVCDQSRRLLALATDPGDLDAEGGRGLLIVDQLASAWGCAMPQGVARPSGACWSAPQPRPCASVLARRGRGAAGGTPDPCHRDHPARPGVKLEPPQPPAHRLTVSGRRRRRRGGTSSTPGAFGPGGIPAG